MFGLTVRSRRTVESDLHGKIQPVLHHERRANSDHLPGTALHRDGEHHPDRRQRGELKGRVESSNFQVITKKALAELCLLR